MFIHRQSVLNTGKLLVDKGRPKLLKGMEKRSCVYKACEHWAKLNKIVSFSGERKQAVSIVNLLLILHLAYVRVSYWHYAYLFK